MFEFGNDGPSVILVAVDGSETSLRAGAYAAGLARRQGSHLICLYVVVNAGMLAVTAPGAVGAFNETTAELGQELRRQIEEQGPRLGIAVEFVERAGNPYTEILRLARDRRVDAVIVGASTKAGHRFVGSLAVHLVRDAEWPITVVP